MKIKPFVASKGTTYETLSRHRFSTGFRFLKLLSTDHEVRGQNSQTHRERVDSGLFSTAKLEMIEVWHAKRSAKIIRLDYLFAHSTAPRAAALGLWQTAR